MKKSTFSVTDTAILAAFCMFLSVIEYLIPKPLPFMRLGLANLPILISLLIFPVRGTLLLSVLKIIGQGLVNGTLFSYIFIFSAAGSMASSLMMIAVFQLLKRRVSLVGVGIAGAMASNAVQIVLAREFIFGKAAILIAPPFLLIGLISAVALAVFAIKFDEVSVWLKDRKTDGEKLSPGTSRAAAAGDPYSKFLFICGFLSLPAFIFQQNLLIKTGAVVFFIILSITRGKKFRLLPNLIMVLGITAANLLNPYGRVIAEAGFFKLTEGALISGLMKSALIIGLIYISRSSIREGLVFPGKFGSLISEVFYFFEEITKGERIGRKNLLKKLDEKLLLLSAPDESGAEGRQYEKKGPLSYAAAAAPAAALWLCLLLPYIN